MTDFLEDKEPESSNYPTQEDSAFTPDEQEAIKKKKEQLQANLTKNRSILRGIESAFWAITSYSLARWLILTSGSGGLALAISSALMINNIVNRDCFDSFRVDRKDGQIEVDGMGKLIKFLFSTLVASFVLWSAIGDFYQTINHSNETIANINKSVDEFNRLPEDSQNKIMLVGGIIIICGLYVVIEGRKR